MVVCRILLWLVMFSKNSLEAGNTTNYVTHRCLMKSVIQKTLYELLNDIKLQLLILSLLVASSLF